MTQDELWLHHYKVVMTFMKKNLRNPSKHRADEHLMHNWVKHNRKVKNAGKLKPERLVLFNKLDLAAQYRHVNQWG